MTDATEELERLQAEAAELGLTLNTVADVTRAYEGMMRQLSATVNQSTKDLGKLDTGFSSSIKRAIDGIVLDGDRFSDAMRGMALSMSRTVYNQAMKPVSDYFGSALAGMVQSAVGGALPFADGAAFSQGRVVPFANGGIVTGPTNFPMRGGLGLMGEAGPEAIMPLTRTADGRLGVAAQGGGRPVQVTMNITTPDVQGFQRSQSQIAAQMARILSHGARNH